MLTSYASKRDEEFEKCETLEEIDALYQKRLESIDRRYSEQQSITSHAWSIRYTTELADLDIVYKHNRSLLAFELHRR